MKPGASGCLRGSSAAPEHSPARPRGTQARRTQSLLSLSPRPGEVRPNKAQSGAPVPTLGGTQAPLPLPGVGGGFVARRALGSMSQNPQHAQKRRRPAKNDGERRKAESSPGPGRRGGSGGAKPGCGRTRPESWGCGAEALRAARAGGGTRRTSGTSPLAGLGGSRKHLGVGQALRRRRGRASCPVSVSPTATFSFLMDEQRRETNAWSGKPQTEQLTQRSELCMPLERPARLEPHASPCLSQ